MNKLLIWVLLVGVAIALLDARRSSEEDDRRDRQRDNSRRDDRSRSNSRATEDLGRKIREDMDKLRREEEDRGRQLQDVRRAIKESIADRIGENIANKLARIIFSKRDAPENDGEEEGSREGSTSLETTINSDIQDLVREIKSKVIDKLNGQKYFASSSFRDKLDKLTKALSDVRLFDERERRDENEATGVNVSTEQTPTSLPVDLEKAIEAAIQSEIERLEEKATSENTPIGSLLVRQLVRGFEVNIEDLRSPWRDFLEAKIKMVEKAKELNQHPQGGKGFDFDKLRVYKASLQEMLAKKKAYVESKVQLKQYVLDTLNNMSRTYRSRTGRAFNYADFLESVLNARVQFPKALEEFLKDVFCRKAALPKNESQEAEISGTTDAAPATVSTTSPTTPSEKDRQAEDIIVDIIDTAKGIKENVDDKVSALKQFIQDTLQPKLDELREMIENFRLDESEGQEGSRKKRSIEEPNNLPANVENNLAEAPAESDEIPVGVMASIEREINSLVSGSVALAPSASEAILDGLMQELLKPFAADILALQELKRKFNDTQAKLLSDVSSLRKESEDPKKVNDIYIKLSELPGNFNELKLYRSQYQSEKAKLTTQVAETLKKLSASYQDRTESPVSYFDVLISLKNSSIELPPVLQDYYTDLSTVARAEGLKLDVAPPSEGGAGSDGTSVVTVSVVGVLAAVVVTMGVSALVWRRRRHQRLYSKIPN